MELRAGLPTASLSRSFSTLASSGRGGVRRCDVEDSDSTSEGVGVEIGEVDGVREAEVIEGGAEMSMDDADFEDSGAELEIPSCKYMGRQRKC